MSIRNKIIIILLLFSIIPVVAIGVIEISKDRKTLEKQISNGSLELSRSLMRHIDEYLYAKYINIQGWTKNRCLNGIASGDEYGNISQFLAGLAEIHDEYYYINCLNTNGQVVASNNVDLKGRDMSTDAGFKEALNGNQTMQDVAFNETTGGYAIAMSVPVWDIPEQSEIIGVLTVVIKWGIVNEMITSLKIGGKEQTLANHIMLTNKDGLVISCFDKKEMFSDNLIEAGIKSAKYAQEHKEGYLIETSEHGFSSFSTYTYSREYKDLPHMHWNLILEQDPKIVFATIYSLKKTMIFTLLGTVAILLISSILLANRISKPILAIVSATKAIGKGGMNTKVPVKSNDEMGLLSTSFNEMVDNLKKSNSELREREEQNRNVLRTALDGFWVTDIEGRILEVNDAYCNLIGYSREELLKMCISDVEAMERPEDTEKHIQQVIKKGGDRFESKHRCKDGRIIDIDVSSNYVKTRGGRFFVFIRDITERKMTEKMLHVKSAYLKLLQVTAVAANEATEIKDAFQPILNEICNHTGWPIGHAYIISKNDPNLLESTTVWQLKDSRHFAGFCNVTEMTKFAKGIGLPGRVLASGKPLWIVDVTREINFPRARIAEDINIKSAFAFPVMVGTKVAAVLEFFSTEVAEPNQQFLDIMADVGTQLGRVIERKRAEEELQDSKERFKELAEAIPEVFWVTSSDFNQMIYVSPAYETVWGYKCKELYEQPKSWTGSIHQEDRERVIAAIEKHVQGKVDFKEEYRIVQPDGSIRWILDRAFSIKMHSGVTDHIVGLAEDITEHKSIEKELTTLNQTLEEKVAKRTAELTKANEELLKMQKLESVGILAGGIAHDFNNYLQGILSNITMAKSYTDSNDKIYLNLTESEKAVIQAKGLSQQLLTFAKGGEPIKKVVSVPELIKESAKFAMSGSNIRVELDLQDCLGLIEVDKGQINQVFNNLFINVEQVMPEGGVVYVKAECVNIEAKELLPLQEGKYVRIAIKDQGSGIPEENLQKIFDPYFTTKEKGSGLGLAITYSIVKKHDGYITVESEMGVGTTFYIYLPASEKEISREPVEGEADKKSIERITSLDGRRILFMEDEGLIRLAVTQHLRNLKYEVETASDGLEAIELYKSARESGKPFNAVIMDLTIPGGMGGAKAIKELFNIDPDVAAIVASGYSNDPIMTNFSEYGFKGVITKPYEMYELDEVLQKVMRKKES